MSQPIDTASVAIVPDFSGFAAAARRDTDRALQQVAQEAERAFSEVERDAAEAGREIATEFRRGGAIAEQSIREVGNQARVMAAQVEVASAAAGSAVGSRIGAGAAVAKAALAAVAFAAAAGLGAITAFGLSSAAKLEQIQIGFEALLGSAEEAKSFLEELQQFAAETPFEFQGIADASRRILAFGQSVGIAKEQVIPTITTIGNLVSVLGGTQESTDAVIRAFGQIASKGRLMGGEILQIAEALPGFNANQAIAAHLGVSVAEALEMQERGEIDAKTAIDALLAGMAQFPGAASAMERQAQSLLGVFSTFKDTISIALTNAFQPVIPAIKDALAELTPILGAAIGELAPALGGLLSTLLPLIGTLVQAIVPILTPILDAITQTLPSITPVLRPVGAAIGKLVEALAPLLPMLAEELVPVVLELVPVIEELAPVFAELVPPLGDVLSALVPIIPPLADLLVALAPLISLWARMAAAVVDFESKFILAPIITAVSAVIGALTAAVSGLVHILVDTDWSQIWDNITGAFKTGIDAIGRFFGGIPTVIGNAWNAVTGFVTNLGSTIGTLATDLIQKFLDLGSNIVSGIARGIANNASAIYNSLKNAVTSAINSITGFLGISSPSKLLADEVGRWLPAGIGQGVEQGAPALVASITGLAGKIAAAVGGGGSSSSLTVDVGGIVVNGSATASDAAVIGDTVGRSVASAARRANIALAVRMA